MEQQISAILEKDPYVKQKAKEQTIYLTDRAACDKSAEMFGSLFTAFVLYQLVKLILFIVYGLIYGTGDSFGEFPRYDDKLWIRSFIEGRGAKQMRENELLQLTRDIAGLRQEVKVMHMERNKWQIEFQKLSMDLGLPEP